MHITKLTRPEVERFRIYFDVADELDGGLTLADLDKKFLRQAYSSAEENDLPWPPLMSAAEDFYLAHLDRLR